MKKILIPMLEIGAGHLKPAMVLRDKLTQLYSEDVVAEVVNFAKVADSGKSEEVLKWVWDCCLKNRLVANCGYHLLDRVDVLSRNYIEIFFNRFLRKGMDYFQKTNPDIIVATHFIPLYIAVRAKRKYNLSYKVIGYNTDPFDSCSCWVEKGADFMIASSDRAKERLVLRGMEEERVKIFPYLVNEKFCTQTFDMKEVLIKKRLDSSKKTVLFSEGGQGIGISEKFVKGMLKRNCGYNIIYVCGNNRRLKERMEELAESNHSNSNLIVMGFVDNMNELIHSSDFVVIKAGASSTFEALLSERPILFSKWATYNEKPNVDFVMEKKVGWYAEDEEAFFEILSKIENTDILHQYKENLKKLKIQSGGVGVSQFIMDLIGGKVR